MNSSTENELKFELTKSDYQALLDLLPRAKEADVFSNCYYTVADDKKAKDWVLRLRQRPGQAGELTLKMGRKLKDGLYSSSEITARVNGINPLDWETSEPVKALRAQVSSKPIIAVGSISNKRQLLSAPLGPAQYWELDRAVYPNAQTLYELEIEYPQHSPPSQEAFISFQEEVSSWAKAQGLSLKPSLKTKYQRFLEAI